MIKITRRQTELRYSSEKMIESLLSKAHKLRIRGEWHSLNDVTCFAGDCRDFLAQLPTACAQLIVTSPPYNIGKKYERRVSLSDYLARERAVIDTCVEKLKPGGSICWQVGNHVDRGEVYPLDTLLYPYFKAQGLQLRNRIVWHFEHGLHCSQRFSGRYETILWFTKSNGDNDYIFNLDPVRVPQKYPGKLYFKGPNKGKPSANPLGKNPGDLWVIPNVKHNHPEKTSHPCQFPVELVERLILALSHEGDLVLDPYMGVGSSLVAAILNKRRAAGSEICGDYLEIALGRIEDAASGIIRVRPRNRPVYEPRKGSTLTIKPWEVTA